MDTATSKPPRHVAVVGSGIAGMAAAFRLHTAGHEVDLIERSSVLGGRFGIDRLGDRPVMMGGKNLGRTYTAMRALLAELGAIGYEPFGINTSRVVDGRLVTFDSSNGPLEKLNWLRKLGPPSDLAKLLYLLSRVRRNAENKFLGSATFTDIAAASDDRPLSAHFGPRIAHNMFRALTVRLNGAEPDEVYLGTFGTNLGMFLDTYDQLTDGVEPAITALTERVAAQTDTRVERLLLDDGHIAGVGVVRNGGPLRERQYDGVVLATPAHAAADIVKSDLPALSSLLMDVRYFPSTVVLVEYEQPVFHQGVRAIVLDDGPCSNAGVYGINDLNIVRYTFSGRAARPTPSPDVLETWLNEAEQRVTSLLGTGPVRRVRKVERIWDAAYCAYLPYHGEFLSKVRAEVEAVPGLALAGDYLRGAQLEACCRSGMEAARRFG
ncbi:protoporphyrinogen/coproporphyrinogen oxidase [Nocardia iowensis]|uniref:FAD-dependent oxidoreductase n=1 Tax=Nocardia iowensis TaxID=204891 RepID=A0ABX8RG98_NOCIO|nr:FAD-dependent oxidoreductase [Nocardia iowensis]QXN88356.1 FAD-dependent oxidoreductase [Nocardia iowensis]